MEKEARIGIIILILSLLALGFVAYIEITDSFASLGDPLAGDGLGRLCSNIEDCAEFCNNNRGQCNDYCQINPINPLCGTLVN
jgi:hypothetical protein